MRGERTDVLSIQNSLLLVLIVFWPLPLSFPAAWHPVHWQIRPTTHSESVYRLSAVSLRFFTQLLIFLNVLNPPLRLLERNISWCKQMPFAIASDSFCCSNADDFFGSWCGQNDIENAVNHETGFLALATKQSWLRARRLSTFTTDGESIVALGMLNVHWT